MVKKGFKTKTVCICGKTGKNLYIFISLIYYFIDINYLKNKNENATVKENIKGRIVSLL